MSSLSKEKDRDTVDSWKGRLVFGGFRLVVTRILESATSHDQLEHKFAMSSASTNDLHRHLQIECITECIENQYGER